MRTVAKTAISHQRPRSLVAQKMAAPSRRSLVAQKVVEAASEKAARSRTTSPAKPTTDASPTPTSTARLTRGRLSKGREELSRRSSVAQEIAEAASKKVARSRATSPAKPSGKASPKSASLVKLEAPPRRLRPLYPSHTPEFRRGVRGRESVARALLVQKGRKYDALAEKMKLLRNQLKVLEMSSASSSLMSQVPGSGVSTPPRSVSTPLACAAVAAQAIADRCADNDGNAYCSKLGCCAQIGHLRKVLEKSTADVLFARFIVASRRSALVSEVS